MRTHAGPRADARARVQCAAMPFIRPATQDDLAGIFEIYDHEVLTGTATFETTPRSPAQRLEWLAAHSPDRYPITVCQESPGAPVAGWARLYPWSPRPAYARTAENSVYVSRAHRARGIGRALLSDLVARARTAGIRVIIARIAEGNPASGRLHASAGFRPVGTLRRVGEKFGRILDVHILELQLGS